MKTFNFFFWLVSLISIFSCDRRDNEVIISPDVQTYIDLLKTNQYDSMNLPSLTYRDIPYLLQYRNETQVIYHFPVNPISSFYNSECKLGMYVLWTIESIRTESFKSKYRILRFPSQNPLLALRNSDELQLVTDSISHAIAAKAYFDWWVRNLDKDFDEFKYIDPLKNTDYKWK